VTLDRFTGCLLGVALGDALGAPYEFRHPPFEVVHEFRPGVFGTAPGHPTDDSTLAVACAEALLHEPGDFAAGYVRRLVAWADSGPPDIGNQTHRAVEAWRAGHPPPDDETAQGNGSLMAVAPVGLRFAGDAGAARAAASAFARLTHPSPAAAECNVTYVGLISAAVHGAGGGDPAALPALPAPPDLGGADSLPAVPAPPGLGDPAALPAVLAPPGLGDPAALPAVPAPSGAGDPAGPGMGWCRLTLHLASRAAQDAAEVGPFEALIRLVGLGGDTDTNAAVAGGLLGALYGAAAWPADLVDRLALREQMEQLAAELWRAARV
jgi:ADP-ribosylglycohydrolase